MPDNEPTPLSECLEEIEARLFDADLLDLLRRFRAEYEQALKDVQALLARTYDDLVEGEAFLNAYAGLSPSAAKQAAINNLAIRKSEMTDEALSLVGHHTERFRNRLIELAAMQADRLEELPPKG